MGLYESSCVFVDFNGSLYVLISHLAQIHAIDSKVISIYLFVPLFCDTFFALCRYNKGTKDNIDLTSKSIACNSAN